MMLYAELPNFHSCHHMRIFVVIQTCCEKEDFSLPPVVIYSHCSCSSVKTEIDSFMQIFRPTFRQVKELVRAWKSSHLFESQFKFVSGRMMATEVGKDTFLYFAYGSNLWTKRIHENNRTARMVAVGKLEGHRLDFGHWTQRWRGASANILPAEGSHVYGVLWELNQSDQPSLDKQEGVLDNIYQRKELTVETVPEGKKVSCMAYRIRDETRQKSVEAHGANLIPSLRYKNVIIQGAKEHGLPEEYVQFLEAVPDNGYNGDVDVNIPLTT